MATDSGYSPHESPPDVELRQGAQRILANTAYRGLADLGSKVISLALYVVMARELGESGFGVFTFGLAVAMLVTALGGFGQDAILVREVARDRRQIDHYFANTLVLKVVLAIPALVLAIAAGTFLDIARDTQIVVALLGAAIVAELLTTTCFGVYQAFERLVYLPVVLITQRTVTAVAGIAALLLGADVVVVSAVYLGGSLVALALALVLVVRRVVRPRFEIDSGFWLPLMRVAAPVGLAGLFGTVLFRIDAAILAWFDTPDVVGNYGAAYRLFEAAFFVSWAVGTAVYPVFSRLSLTSEPPVRLVFDRGLKLVLALLLPFSIGGLILGRPLVELLYGADYDRADEAFMILAPAIAFHGIMHVGGLLLVAQNRQLLMAGITGVVAALNIAANFVLVPLYSLEGAAFTALGSQVLLGLLFLVYGARAAGGVDLGRILAGPAIAGALAAGAMFVLRDELLLAIAAGGLLYAAALAVFERLAYPDDAQAIADFLRRRS
jgi:O-antigen/teichoic acid export membrane protein